MKKFRYSLYFSPFVNIVRAKNYKDAKQKIRKLWPEYNIDKCLFYLHQW